MPEQYHSADNPDDSLYHLLNHQPEHNGFVFDADQVEMEDDEVVLPPLSPPDRIDIIHRLRQINPELSENKDDKVDRLILKEGAPQPYFPTVGIEIEVRKSAIARRDQWTDDFELDTYAEYDKTMEAGVPQGEDNFWEFAHRPANHYMTLVREVQALYDMGFLSHTYRKYALHLTLGGVENDDQSLILARALEGSGWATTGGRLMRPYLLKTGSWTVKGHGGVMGRGPEDLEGDILELNEGIEIRTLQLSDLQDFQRTLHNAYYLGAGLRAYQMLEDPVGLSRLKRGEKVDTTKKLAEVWEDFSNQVLSVFHNFELSSPRLGTPYDPREATAHNGAHKLAHYLDWAKDTPTSKGAEFVSTMQDLIIEARHRIAKILEEDKLPTAGHSRSVHKRAQLHH